MKLIKYLSLTLATIPYSVLLSFPLFAFAAQEEEGCLGCLGCGGGFFFFIVLIFIVNIALLAWVAKDAKNRNMDSPILWLILVLTTSFIGLIIYMASRTKGVLVVCEHCKGKKLEYAKVCPHCGNKSSEEKKEEENNNFPKMDKSEADKNEKKNL